MNKTWLYGKIETEPQLKEFGENEKVVLFLLSTIKRYRKNGQFKTKKDIHFCCSFDEKAEYAIKLLHKDDNVIIEGELSYRGFETKEGVKNQRTEIHVLYFRVVSNKDQTTKSTSANPLEGIDPSDLEKEGKTPSQISAERLEKQKKEAVEMEDDLPF